MSRSYFQNRDRWSTRATEWVLFALARMLRWVTAPLGTWTLSGGIAFIGSRVAMAVPVFRRRALDNLELVWPEMSPAEHRRIAHAAASQFARLMVEYSRLEQFLPRVALKTEGLEHLEAAKAAGKGAILVTAHYGNWETARLAAKHAGCETGIIYRAFNNRYLDRYTMKLIPCAGTPVMQKGRQGMRQLIQHVARGGFVMILVDQRNSGAPYLDFMGHPAETVVAAADLAHRTGAALIPARALRNTAEQRFDITFEPPISGSNPREMMQLVNNRIAAWVREHPEQWFWFHRRWRTTTRSRTEPDG